MQHLAIPLESCVLKFSFAISHAWLGTAATAQQWVENGVKKSLCVDSASWTLTFSGCEVCIA